MTDDQVATLLGLGFWAGFVAGWMTLTGINALERWLIKRLAQPFDQTTGAEK